MISEADILYEDNHFLAVNKHSGVLSQGDKTGDEPLIEQVKFYLKKKYNKPGNVFAGLAHRLDRPVSGVVLISRTSKGLERINKLFQSRQVEKKYLAITSTLTAPPQGRLTNWLLKDAAKNRTDAFDKEVRDGKIATLDYRILLRKKKEYLIEILPLTGRPHQIRVQLSHIGSPIKGDLKYGYPSANKDKSICLHAWQLSFIHPVSKQPVHIKAPVPASEEWTLFRRDVK